MYAYLKQLFIIIQAFSERLLQIPLLPNLEPTFSPPRSIHILPAQELE